MKEINYAHNDTFNGERITCTSKYNKPRLREELEEIRRSASRRGIPVSGPETLNFLRTFLLAAKPANILEIGTAVGLSASLMAETCPYAHITTIEKNEAFYAEALENFRKLGIDDRIRAVCGDAAEALGTLSGKYSLIFLDGAKVQYVKYLPALKALLEDGGALVADDVLLFGYVTGEEPTPPKRRMLVEHIKEYLAAVTSDSDFATTVLNVGNGVSVSVKISVADIENKIQG